MGNLSPGGELFPAYALGVFFGYGYVNMFKQLNLSVI